jgi:hypothetical protein
VSLWQAAIEPTYNKYIAGALLPGDSTVGVLDGVQAPGAFVHERSQRQHTCGVDGSASLFLTRVL